MSFPDQHEIHTRRKGRNMAVGLLLGAFVVIVFSVSLVKLSKPQNIDTTAPNYSATAGSE
ncbi:MAG: cytochrome C oxidase assembly protein [Rhodobacteraceae bacterium]|nr:cytochrome C oxidase assembly protein [Paracoccaceae bacterium]